MTEEELIAQRQLEEEQIKKQKYREVLGQLSTLNGNVSDLQSSIADLKTIISMGLLVDNKIIKEELYDSIKSSCEKVSSNTQTAIGIIRSKI